MLLQFTHPKSELMEACLPYLTEQDLSLDIETTGLSAEHSSIYCIGTGRISGDNVIITQYFACTPEEEKDALTAFCSDLKSFAAALSRRYSRAASSRDDSAFLRILTYNGRTFDLPFIRKRCALYGLPDPFEGIMPFDPASQFVDTPSGKTTGSSADFDTPASAGSSVDALPVEAAVPSPDFDTPASAGRADHPALLCHFDLFGLAGVLNRYLKLPNRKQKTVEAFLGLSREDLYSGKDLIPVYKQLSDTCRKQSAAAARPSCESSPELALLSLHNREDTAGLFPLLSLCAYLQPGETRGMIRKCFLEQDRNSLCFCAIVDFPDRFPVSLTCSDSAGVCRLRGREGLFSFPVQAGELRHYFPDYENYYYLPAEDKVVHKSVGQYVDRKFRKKATRQNCYVKTVCSYLSVPKDSELNYYKKDPADHHSYLVLPDSCTQFAHEENGALPLPEDFPGQLAKLIQLRWKAKAL